LGFWLLVGAVEVICSLFFLNQIMKNYIIASLLLFGISNAQQVQWANKAIKYSSDLGGKQNGIKRILGRPDVFPQCGASPNAWTPKNALDGYEYVIVGFEQPQTVKQVAVFENLNAGCVTKISVDNGSGKFETVWHRKKDWTTPSYKSTIIADRHFYYNKKRRKIQESPDVSVNAGIEYAMLDQPFSNVVAVKVEFNFALLPGQKQIDAIGISDSTNPIEVSVKTNQKYENLLPAEQLDFGDFDISAPVLAENGKKLYFTVVGENNEIIYSSWNEDGKWSKPTPEIAALNTNNVYNYIEVLNSDFILKGGAKYLAGSGDCGLELITKKDGRLVSEGQLQIMAYNNYDEHCDAAISTDGNILILGIETDFTQGGADLYFAKRKPDGTYTILENLGKTVNTAADENLPFLLSDNKTLLFCSNGFSCFGDYDIYITTRLDDSWKKWSEPINLGSKINGSGFDGAPFYDEVNDILYFVKSVNGTSKLHTVTLKPHILRQ